MGTSQPSLNDPAINDQFLLDFVETAGVGLHWVGADGTILWANVADYEPLGYTADEYVGHHIAEFHADADTIADILSRLTSGERLRDYEARLRCKDGSIRSVMINSSVLFDDQGRFVHTRCFTHDITESKQLDEAKEQFVSILGHDLRNPLSVISVAAHFMLASDDLTEPHVRAVTRIARASDRMSRMIADLLDFARGRLGGGIPIQRGPADLASITEHAIEELRGLNHERDVALDVVGDTHGHWDADRVAQVVSNLVGNGLEHGDGPVKVSIRGTDDVVVLEVSNGGTPIPPHALSMIFDPFSYRAAGSSARTGLGLGLFIAREIVRAHGGTIHASSTGDEGTTLTVRWPRQ